MQTTGDVRLTWMKALHHKYAIMKLWPEEGKRKPGDTAGGQKGQECTANLY